MPLLVEDPQRVTITHVDSAEFMTAQHNPDEVKEKLAAAFNRLEVLGHPSREMQWTGTENLIITCELGFDAFSARGAGRLDVSGSVGIEDARRFLHGFFYPQRGEQTIGSGGTSECLFSWPNLYAVACRLTQLEITHRRFASTMAPTLFSAALTIEVVYMERRTREDVLDYGTLAVAID